MLDWLAQNPELLVTLLIIFATLVFTVFAKVVINIFMMGVKFKSDYATKRDQLRFETEMKEDMRGYRDELLSTVMVSAMEMIREKLTEIKDIREVAQTIKIIEKELEVKIKMVMDKVDEIKSLSDNVRSLDKKVERLQYGDNKNTRRKE